MPSIKLKLYEYYQLDSEINGSINSQTGDIIRKGLLTEKLNLVTKYWLTDLSKHIAAEKAIIEDLKIELIKKYGKETEQGISLPIYIPEEKDKDGKVIKPAELNPDYIKFEEEFNILLQEEKELDYHDFKLEDFKNIETSDNYTVFYKLIQID